MLKRLWWVGGLHDFRVSPRPLWTLNLSGFGVWGLKDLGPGLDNIILGGIYFYLLCLCHMKALPICIICYFESFA